MFPCPKDIKLCTFFVKEVLHSLFFVMDQFPNSENTMRWQIIDSFFLIFFLFLLSILVGFRIFRIVTFYLAHRYFILSAFLLAIIILLSILVFTVTAGWVVNIFVLLFWDLPLTTALPRFPRSFFCFLQLGGGISFLWLWKSLWWGETVLFVLHALMPRASLNIILNHKKNEGKHRHQI